jgi:hypothetical protein
MDDIPFLFIVEILDEYGEIIMMTLERNNHCTNSLIFYLQNILLIV